MTQTTLVIAADLHINSTVGLCKPVVNLDDGGTYHASRSQCWLWECWLDFTAQAEAAPGRKVLILNGDLGDLDTKRRSYQLVSPNKATVLSLLIDTLEPLLSVADAVYIVRGTLAHTGKSAWLEEAIGKDIDTAVKNGEQYSWYHIRGAVEGVRLDISHHTSMGGLPWTEKHAAMKLAEKVVWRYMIDMKQPPPDLAVRSHNHRKSDSFDNYETRGITTSAFQLLTEYAYRTGRENDLADVGGMLIPCENGKYTYNNHINYRPKGLNRIWALKI